MLDGDSSGADDVLQRRNVQEDEGDYDGEDHGGEKREVLSGLVENRRLLEDAEATGTCCEEIEKLPYRSNVSFVGFGKLECDWGKRT